LTSILIVSHEPLTEQMTGPTIRNWELAHVLAHHMDVTLAVPGQPEVKASEFKVVGWDNAPPEDLIATHDVVQASGYLLDLHPGIAKAHYLVVDLYDPFPLENLHMHVGATPDERYRIAAQDRAVQTRSLRAGDVFLCASERQRDFWLGWLAGAGRVNPYVHFVDAGLQRFLIVVPFGVPDEHPIPHERRFRGVVSGIAEEDLVVIWGGGIWNWFDPLTLITAADRTRDRLPQLRVVFPAPTSPSPEVMPMRMSDEARRLSDQLGLTGSRVFFGSSWIPYNEHGSVLLESDIGVSLHQDSVETRMSFRTRILDYLWAGLPIIATDGDSMADLIRVEDLGAVVQAGSVDAVVTALVELGTDPERRRACAKRSEAAASRFRWSVAAKPLIDYCKAPYQAPDRAVLRGESPTTPWDGRVEEPSPTRNVFVRAARVWRKEGPGGLIRRSSAYLPGRRKQ
jgi:glycosyltransferase involved in cell wall biosynthesis